MDIPLGWFSAYIIERTISSVLTCMYWMSLISPSSGASPLIKRCTLPIMRCLLVPRIPSSSSVPITVENSPVVGMPGGLMTVVLIRPSAVCRELAKNLFSVILFTGLRESEAIGLTWDCIDFQKGTMKVYRQLQKRLNQDGGYTFAPLKNNKTRSITLSRYVVSILRQQKLKQAADKIKAGEFWQGWFSEEEEKTALVFTNDQLR